MGSGRAMLTVFALGVFGVLTVTGVFAADEPKVDAKTALAKLKGLAGEWVNEAAPGDPSQKIVYRVISNGTVVMETLFPNTTHEMVSMYMIDGDELRMTHYCASGNQPKLKVDFKISSADKLEFAFEGGTNLDASKDMHMHSGRIVFKDKNHMETEWDGYLGGKKTGSQRFSMQRN